MNYRVRLCDLAPGEEATIAGFAQDSAELTRLRELGMSDGALFRVIKFAPFGDPVEIKIRGFHLSIGKSVARQVMVCKTRAAG